MSKRGEAKPAGTTGYVIDTWADVIELEPARRSRQRLKVPPAWRPRERAELVRDVAGGASAAAGLLGVATSQASRWASGETVPSLDQARLLIDLEHVMAHALLLWTTPEGVNDWLTTPNGHLDGQRPIAWIREHGTTEVVDALQAETAGAYA